MIRQEIKNLVKKAIKELYKQEVEVEVEKPENADFGDYSTNAAMRLKKSPQEIANRIKSPILEKIEVKNGFINFFLSKEYLFDELKKILKEKEKYGSSEIGKGKIVIIDYSSPNIAKHFGISHLRSTIIGQALYNIYKFLGWKTIGDNHLGDWGTQFGNLIYQIKKEKKDLKKLTVEEMERLYVKFHKAIEKNPGIKEEGRKWFKKLERGEKEARKIWKKCVNASLKEFERIYKLLGIKFDLTLGESFYQPMVKKIIEEAKEKKVAIESQGAVIIQYPKNELPPAILLKSDGTTTYLARDLATIKYRLKRWKPDLIIYEVGADQELHFKQLFKAVELLDWAKKEKFFHVAHGLYRTKTGKFSTRSGETIHLEKVLKEAILRAEEIIEKSEIDRGLSEKERKKITKMVGIGAIKYNDLSQYYNRDIVFDWNKVLNLKGNSAPYLQYTYARCRSVLRKAKLKVVPRKIKIINLKLEEENILRTIYRFPEVIEEAAKNFSPNLLCNFTFDLAQKYNLFYNMYPIIKAESEEVKIFRLAITMAVSQVLKNILSLLGISAPEKM